MPSIQEHNLFLGFERQVIVPWWGDGAGTPGRLHQWDTGPGMDVDSELTPQKDANMARTDKTGNKAIFR